MGRAGTGSAWCGGMSKQVNLLVRYYDLSANTESDRGIVLARLLRAYAPEVGALVLAKDRVTAEQACKVG